MAEIIKFRSSKQKPIVVEQVRTNVNKDWELTEIKKSGLAEYSPEKPDENPVFEAIIQAAIKPDYSTFFLRGPSGNTYFMFTVTPFSQVENFLWDKKETPDEALRVLATVFKERNWTKNFVWSEGFIITENGQFHKTDSLPDVVSIRGGITFDAATGVRLPKKMHVFGTVTVRNSSLIKMPEYLFARNVEIDSSRLPKIADRLRVLGSATIRDSEISQIADAAVVGGTLKISEVSKKLKFPKALRVGGDLIIEHTGIDTEDCDVVVGGKLTILPNMPLNRYALDFIGRLMTTGSTVQFITKASNESPDVGIFQGSRNEIYECLVEAKSPIKTRTSQFELLSLKGEKVKYEKQTTMPTVKEFKRFKRPGSSEWSFADQLLDDVDYS